MIRLGAFTAGIRRPIFLISQRCAADFSSYPGFEFGANLAAAVKRAGVKASGARLITPEHKGAIAEARRLDELEAPQRADRMRQSWRDQ